MIQREDIFKHVRCDFGICFRICLNKDSFELQYGY